MKIAAALFVTSLALPVLAQAAQIVTAAEKTGMAKPPSSRVKTSPASAAEVPAPTTRTIVMVSLGVIGAITGRGAKRRWRDAGC
ncbi:hypothetical protein [Sphingomonas sp. ID0503]|uniref:hypothetical protein n=1 Tax=Sphingomonas sp. ID0503 TaxID=3399691 RepID=UPI003AFB2BDA